MPGIDACLVGTGDLAMSMGYAGQVNHPEVQAAAEKVFDLCRQKGLHLHGAAARSRGGGPLAGARACAC